LTFARARFRRRLVGSAGSLSLSTAVATG